MPPQAHRAFTFKFGGRARVLQTPIKICEALTPTETQSKNVNLREYIGIWDTGATSSAITKRVVEDLNLKPIGVVEVHHAKGKSLTNCYLVNIALPSQVMFGEIRVTEAELISDDGVPTERQPQMLVGMDIIGAGDFAVTNGDGKTTLTFCFPSSRNLDFVPESDRMNFGGSRAERRARQKEMSKHRPS